MITDELTTLRAGFTWPAGVTTVTGDRIWVSGMAGMEVMGSVDTPLTVVLVLGTWDTSCPRLDSWFAVAVLTRWAWIGACSFRVTMELVAWDAAVVVLDEEPMEAVTTLGRAASPLLVATRVTGVPRPEPRPGAAMMDAPGIRPGISWFREMVCGRTPVARAAAVAGAGRIACAVM